MNESYLCLADATGRAACALLAGAAGLKYVSGTPGTEEKIAFAMRELAEHGVHVREEHFSPGRIDVDLVKVGADDARYLEGCVAEFRLRGWSAKVYPKPIANVWRKLYVLPVPQEFRASVAEHLDMLPPEALEKLQAELDLAAADLDRSAAA